METTTATQAKFTVPACNIPTLEKRLAKLNRKAGKLGCEPIRWTKTFAYVAYEAYQPTHAPMDGAPLYNRVLIPAHNWEANQTSLLPAQRTGNVVEFFDFTVEGSSPTLNGWMFIAALEPVNADGELLNVIQTVPGQTCPTEYRDVVGRCDHCHTNRKRNQTFLVRHEDGTTKCVGRQCIKDFLGYNADPTALVHAAEWMCQIGELCRGAEDEGWLGGGFTGTRSWDLEHFVAWTAGMVDAYGWLGRGKAYEQGWPRSLCTADKVIDSLIPPWSGASNEVKQAWEEQRAKACPTDAHKELAAKAIEWAKEQNDPSNEYLTNLNTVARAGYVTEKFAGLAASMVVAYNRAMEQETNRKAPKAPSNHVGAVGKRLELVVTCNRVIARESEWGTTGIHKLTDEAGNDLVWFASGSTAWLAEGETYTVKATVKEHGEYKGRKQTVVSRVSIKKG